ncbi:hypothetical protein VLL09_04955 [Dehalococcoides mccartyi]|uniref:DUF1376 domain-containing protein n=1 Tax=Dehalococcoides mccartyi TaxID=61435 RepID=A0AB38Z8C7_9CHLR|nr:hypothetical protein [Dehalococcoides mccartyi]WRO06742.1 hypothetical protein VLL09_04955 [Dehalococcoides mccartyi]
MRRAIARGRVFPQSYSTDRRYGRLSLKAIVLFHLMWVNADDQGRLCGDPEELKYAVCPNIDHISKADVPELLVELERNKLIKVYDTPRSPALQMLDWWEVQRLQWAWPSEYPPPGGWLDRLRYKKGASTVITQNWHTSAEPSGEIPNGTQVSDKNSSGDCSGEPLAKPSSFPQTPNYYPENEKEEEIRSGRGRGNSPEHSGECSGEKYPSPSSAGHPDLEILNRLTACFKKEWGRVKAEKPYEIIPRAPDARESAQLRDLAKELSAAGGCPLDYIDQAFRDAAGRPDKMHISYVRAIILDWLGIERTRSP